MKKDYREDGMRRFGEIAIRVLAICAILVLTPVLAEEAPGTAGYWNGSVDTGMMPMEFSIDLVQTGDGSWKGKIDIPSQGIRNLPLDALTVEGTSITFGVTGIQGGPVFTGELSEDGLGILGTLTQSGISFPFFLERSDGPSEEELRIYEEYERDGVPGTGLQGTWLGILEARPARLRMIVRVSASADGALTATLDMPDQKSGELYLDSISLDGATVSFTFNQLRASYSGEMSADGSTVIGSWVTGERDFPLNLKRQPTGER
jgi:hypothetical protein